MKARKFPGMLCIAATIVSHWLFSLSASAQVAPVKPSQADDIPSTRQTLSGRLFFSREQRALLDRLRNGEETVAGGVVDAPGPSQINGFVKRSDGEAAVWIDQRAQYKVSREYAEQIRPQDVGGLPGKIRILSDAPVRFQPQVNGDADMNGKPKAVPRRDRLQNGRPGNTRRP